MKICRYENRPMESNNIFLWSHRLISYEGKKAIRLGKKSQCLLREDTVDASLMAESEEELKSFLMKVTEAQHLENYDQGIWSHHFMANRWGNSVRLYFGGAPKALQMVIAGMKLKDAYFLEGKL